MKSIPARCVGAVPVGLAAAPNEAQQTSSGIGFSSKQQSARRPSTASTGSSSPSAWRSGALRVAVKTDVRLHTLPPRRGMAVVHRCLDRQELREQREVETKARERRRLMTEQPYAQACRICVRLVYRRRTYTISRRGGGASCFDRRTHIDVILEPHALGNDEWLQQRHDQRHLRAP